MRSAETLTNEQIDRANAKFWDELCGTSFARHVGITDRSPESLDRFDQAYLDFYPYLLEHVPLAQMRDKRVLEVGLGYGTLGQKIAEAGADYIGLDIAAGPVQMINHRLPMQGLPGRAIRGSMLHCPLPDESCDYVVAIGCFHHTGDLQRCLDETWRVLRRGGWAHVMVYNALSYRQWLHWPTKTLAAAFASTKRTTATEGQRWAYDFDSSSTAAPETVFVSRRSLRAMMAHFSKVRLSLENCNDYAYRGSVEFEGKGSVRLQIDVFRTALLPWLGKMAGLDIYAAAQK